MSITSTTISIERRRGLLRDVEVAELLGLPVSTLRYWRLVNSGPTFYRVGGRAIRYAEDEVLRWAKARSGGEPAGVTR